MKKDPRKELPEKDGIYHVEYKLGFRQAIRFEVGDSFDEMYWKESVRYWIDTEEKVYTKEEMLQAYCLGCTNGLHGEFDFSKWINEL